MTTFEFRNPGRLVDDELDLILVEKYPGDPGIGYVPAYRFEMRLTGTDTKVGNCELRIGNSHHLIMYGGHIAYEVLPQHRGHRYAARACRLLFPLAQSHGMETLWITCNPDNIASRRTCEFAGVELIEIVELPEYTDMYQRGERQKCRYKVEL